MSSSRCKACNTPFHAKRFEDDTFEDMCPSCILGSEDEDPDTIYIAEFIASQTEEEYAE